MKEEILEIQNLNNDDLLSLYDMMDKHIQYLQSSIINIAEEEASEEAAEDSKEESGESSNES